MSQSGSNAETQQEVPADSPAWTRSQLSQALQDLARGEQTANALESNLSKLENKLDELLASFEEIAGDAAQGKDSNATDASKSKTEDHNEGQKSAEKE